MKRLLTTTALVAMTSMPLAAEQHSTSATSGNSSVQVGEQEVRVSNLMDATVYMPQDVSSDVADVQITDGAPEDWTEIGSISDVFVDQSGQVSTVVLSPNDSAGTDANALGLMMDSVTVKTSENGDQIFVVYTGDKVSLEQGEEFDQAQAEEDGMMSANDRQDGQMAASESGTMQNDANADSSQMADAQNAEMESNGLTIRAAELNGYPVYVPGEGSTGDEIPMEVTGVDDAWERVGEIGSVVLSRDGEIKSVTLDAGGFLGMGEKEVETTMEELRFVRDSDDDGEYFIVFTGDRSALEEREEYDEATSREQGEQRLTNEDIARSTRANAQETGETVASGSDSGGEAETEILAAEELDGAPVYDSTGEEIGNISELVVNDSGEISEVVIDVGGFLGLGEKPVAISYTDLMIDKSVDTAFGDVRVSVNHSRDELESMERWTQ